MWWSARSPCPSLAQFSIGVSSHITLRLWPLQCYQACETPAPSRAQSTNALTLWPRNDRHPRRPREGPLSLWEIFWNVRWTPVWSIIKYPVTHTNNSSQGCKTRVYNRKPHFRFNDCRVVRHVLSFSTCLEQIFFGAIDQCRLHLRA